MYELVNGKIFGKDGLGNVFEIINLAGQEVTPANAELLFNLYIKDGEIINNKLSVPATYLQHREKPATDPLIVEAYYEARISEILEELEKTQSFPKED